MTDLATLLAVGAAFWVVAASPGPANISNAAIAMRHGRRPSFAYAFGLSVALAFWGVLAATGLGAMLQASVWMLTGLKLFGGGYLLWLAWKSAGSARRVTPDPAVETRGGRWFWRGLVLNLSNPKSVIAWMAALSMGLTAEATPASVALATLVCVTVAFANNFAYSMVFSMGGMMAAYQRFRRWIDGVSAALFAMAGLALIRSAVSR